MDTRTYILIGILVVCLPITWWVIGIVMKTFKVRAVKAKSQPTLIPNLGINGTDLKVSFPDLVSTLTARSIERARQGGLTDIQTKAIIATLEEAQRTSPTELRFVGREKYRVRKG